MIGRTARWVDDRLGLSGFARSTLDKVFPDHWSFLLGEVAMYSFVVLLVTGVFLTFFFQPSMEPTTYDGAYAPMHGVPMSQAYESTLRLSFDVRTGLVMRQVHHWSAIVFLAAIVVHVCRVFFTGAFRRPREVNWIIGTTMLILALANGFTGYSLPDDLLSGTGIRIAYSIVLSIPLVGDWLAFLFFGGEFPAPELIGRLYILHVLIVPAAIAALLGAHLAIVWRQKHTQFPGPGRRQDNVVGTRFWPTYAAKSIGLFAVQVGVLALLGGFAQVNPVWMYGPFEAAAVSTAAQPDWYVGFLEGALRVFPPWDLTLFGYTVSEVFLPGVVLPGLTFGALYAWPFIERRFTGDHGEHHLLDRPRDRPVRTGIGAGVLTFYVVLTAAGGQDIFAQQLDVSVVAVMWALRVMLLVLPVVVGLLTAKVCRDLARAKPLEPAVDVGAGPAEVGAGEVAQPEPAPVGAAPAEAERVETAEVGGEGGPGVEPGAEPAPEPEAGPEPEAELPGPAPVSGWFDPEEDELRPAPGDGSEPAAPAPA